MLVKYILKLRPLHDSAKSYLIAQSNFASGQSKAACGLRNYSITMGALVNIHEH